MKKLIWVFSGILLMMLSACLNREAAEELWAEDILGNPEYRAISFGGYRHSTRDSVPGIEELIEDVKIMHAMGFRILRTYNTQEFEEVANLLEAIAAVKKEDPDFEMYLMLGAWIQCQDAFEDYPNHDVEDFEMNQAEIDMAIEMAKNYPDIVKVIAVGNEAMVHWAGSYFVHPRVILKYVNYLQELKENGELPSRLWITSSDNFASWGGEDDSYHIPELRELMKAVDYLSIHTYPFHDSHYHPDFWIVPEEEEDFDKIKQIERAVERANHYARSQYRKVFKYMKSLDIHKDIHIGETGWSSVSHTLYGDEGSKAADEFKQGLYYQKMRKWTDQEKISCFFFEAFDEKWKDPSSPEGSENHFGLIDLEGKAKYAIWDLVDKGVFEDLRRGNKPIRKSYDGDEAKLLKTVNRPPLRKELGIFEISTIDENRKIGEEVKKDHYLIFCEKALFDEKEDIAFPSAKLKLNAWEGSCALEIRDSIIQINTNSAAWWGCGLELQAEGKGENLSEFMNGSLNFEIKGESECTFQLGFQCGIFGRGDQVNNFVIFGPEKSLKLTNHWNRHTIPLKDLTKTDKLNDITSLFYLRCDRGFDGKEISLKNIYYSKY